jgi:hypothetical protein
MTTYSINAAYIENSLQLGTVSSCNSDYILVWNDNGGFTKYRTLESFGLQSGRVPSLSSDSTTSTITILEKPTLNTGTSNVFVGFGAASASSVVNSSLLSGANAGKNLVNADGVIALGKDAMLNSTVATSSIVIGRCAAPNTVGIYNIFIGDCVAYTMTIGSCNTFLGAFSGYSATSSNGNVFIGYKSGCLTTTGNSNVFIGSDNGAKNTTGFGNVFSGYRSGCSNTIGNGNVFIGQDTGSANTSGDGNVVIGYLAGSSFSGLSNNIFIGSGAARYTCTSLGIAIGDRTAELADGVSSVLIGNAIGVSLNFTSCYNTFLGACSGPTQSATYSNSIAIGYGAKISSSCQLSIASSGNPLGTSSTYTDYPGNICRPAFWLCVTVNGVNGKIPIYGV